MIRNIFIILSLLITFNLLGETTKTSETNLKDIKSDTSLSASKLSDLSEKKVTPEEIIKKLDNLYRGKSSYSLIEMKIQTSYFKRTLKMKVWSKGEEKTLVKIVRPKKDKGIATLKRNKDIHNFFPKINKVMKVPSSMMMGSWMGSDFTNDDLVKESTYTKDYNFKLVDSADKTKYQLELKPKKTSVTVWGKIVIIVDKKTLLPISQSYYDEHDKKVRVMNFKNVKEINGRLLPTTMELVPLSKNKKGNKTTFTYKKIKFDIKLKKNFFSIQNLRNK